MREMTNRRFSSGHTSFIRFPSIASFNISKDKEHTDNSCRRPKHFSASSSSCLLFMRRVLGVILKIVFIIGVFVFLINMLHWDSSYVGAFAKMFLMLVVTFAVVWFCGMNRHEHLLIKNYVTAVFCRFKSR